MEKIIIKNHSMKELLIKLNACEPAIDWAGDKTWKEIYNECHRGDWLLWLWHKTINHKSEDDFKLLTLAKARCANTVRHLMKDKRSTDAIDACFAFVDGKISRQDLSKAAYAAAYAAADYAAADYAAYAAAAAAYAAAYYAAADYAAYAAAAADDDARTHNQKLTSDIVRDTISFEKWKI